MHVEGIVLSSIPFQERSRIITLFTTEGMLKCLVKRGVRLDRIALATPLTRGHYLLRARKSMLYELIDGTSLDAYLELRSSLARLHQAAYMGRALLHTQWPDKPVPLLYALFQQFLQVLVSDHREQTSWHIYFLIKLLKHEGLLPSHPSGWNQEECGVLMNIAQQRLIQHFPPLSPELTQKVEALFDETFEGSDYGSKMTRPSAMSK